MSHEDKHTNRSAQLYLIGAGISFPEHLTFQTMEILKLCARIYTNLPPQELDKLPDQFRSKIVALWSSYIENRNRTDNYTDVADIVFDATSAERPVGWLTNGHPMIFDSVSQTLLKKCSASGTTLSIVPAISCLDTIFAQLGYDPADGLFIFEAAAAVEQDIALNSRFAACLLQPSAFGSSVAHYNTEWLPDLRPLGTYLGRFYGREHRCALVRSLSQAGSSSITWRTLATLHEITFAQVAGSTLFVPSLNA
jgi:uncharacterized protein YabN with tetrapyrrole methylase and pyrophosphatase domain